MTVPNIFMGLKAEVCNVFGLHILKLSMMYDLILSDTPCTLDCLSSPGPHIWWDAVLQAHFITGNI